MCTKRKSKWSSLVSIGLLIVVLPLLIKGLSSYRLPDIWYIFMMGTGIAMEFIGLMGIIKEKGKARNQ